MSDQRQDFIINNSDYQKAVSEYKNIVFKIYHLNAEIEKQISNVLVAVLEQINAAEIKNSLFTILRELIVNAIKANSKRIHFEQKNLDLNDAQQYKKGIETFREELAERPQEFKDLARQNDLFVLVSMSYKDEFLRMSVINNVVLSNSELKRIKEKVKVGSTIDDLGSAMEQIIDFSEGAGLGIPMIMLMLRKLGSDRKGFQIATNDGSTKVQVSVPKEYSSKELDTKIKEKIFAEVEQLPSFPENIQQLQKLISNPNSSIERISHEVKKDPSLTADLLRVANSAGYATIKRISSIDEALKNIGLKGFNNILVAYSTLNIVAQRYKKVYKEVWTHSLKTSFIAEKLAKELNQKKIKETAYLASLLHDIGKMVLLSMHSKTINFIENKADAGMGELNTIEEVSFGVSHSQIGAVIAGHWNFSEDLIEAIQLHHQPLSASDENRNLVYITYLANSSQDVARGYGDFANIEQPVLEYFGLDENSFKILAQRLDKAFADSQNV